MRKENENFVLPGGWLGHETPEVRAGKREGEKADPGREQGCRAALPQVTHRCLQARLRRLMEPRTPLTEGTCMSRITSQ